MGYRVGAVLFPISCWWLNLILMKHWLNLTCKYVRRQRSSCQVEEESIILPGIQFQWRPIKNYVTSKSHKNPRNISWESKLPSSRRKWKCHGWATPCGYHARWGVTIIMVTPTIAEGSNLHLKLGVGHLLHGHNWVSWEGQSVTITKAGVCSILQLDHHHSGVVTILSWNHSGSLVMSPMCQSKYGDNNGWGVQLYSISILINILNWSVGPLVLSMQPTWWEPYICDKRKRIRPVMITLGHFYYIQTPLTILSSWIWSTQCMNMCICVCVCVCICICTCVYLPECYPGIRQIVMDAERSMHAQWSLALLLQILI